MKWLKQYWVPVLVFLLLILTDALYPQSHAAFPVALAMWCEFAFISFICFAGLYSCTLTGGDRQRVRHFLVWLLALRDKVPLAWYHRLAIALLMAMAGWGLTAVVYACSFSSALIIKDEIKATRE
ncbi:hypothetical protein DPF89_01183 [Salmonella enterica subsp. enterica serovar Napoli]|nr:hypothetical protein DPF89_01183 [Salmonella enterica subsp. enterica serovar Napoli]